MDFDDIRIEITGPFATLRRNPRLSWLVAWVGDLSRYQAAMVLEAFREGTEFPCEAVEAFGSTAALVQAAATARTEYPVELPRKMDWGAVDELFEHSAHQVDVLLGLYRMAYGPASWAQVESMHDIPGVCEADNKRLMERMIRFDEQHHPQTLPGSIWLRRGFRTRCDALQGFVYPCTVEWKEE